MSKSPEEQLAQLRRMGGGRAADWLTIGFTAGALGLLAAGLYTGEPPYAMVGVFVAIVAVSMWQTAPHLRNAVQALRRGERVKGTVTISITEWSDSRTYTARVDDPLSGAWCFDFIPQGWRPAEGPLEAELYRAPGVRWPALVVTGQGVLYPRGKPKRPG